MPHAWRCGGACASCARAKPPSPRSANITIDNVTWSVPADGGAEEGYVSHDNVTNILQLDDGTGVTDCIYFELAASGRSAKVCTCVCACTGVCLCMRVFV